jgi:hypothetical protein
VKSRCSAGNGEGKGSDQGVSGKREAARGPWRAEEDGDGDGDGAGGVHTARQAGRAGNESADGCSAPALLRRAITGGGLPTGVSGLRPSLRVERLPRWPVSPCSPAGTLTWVPLFATLNTAYTVGSSILWVHTFIYHIFIHFNSFHPY